MVAFSDSFTDATGGTLNATRTGWRTATGSFSASGDAKTGTGTNLNTLDQGATSVTTNWCWQMVDAAHGPTSGNHSVECNWQAGAASSPFFLVARANLSSMTGYGVTYPGAALKLFSLSGTTATLASGGISSFPLTLLAGDLIHMESVEVSGSYTVTVYVNGVARLSGTGSGTWTGDGTNSPVGFIARSSPHVFIDNFAAADLGGSAAANAAVVGTLSAFSGLLVGTAIANAARLSVLDTFGGAGIAANPANAARLSILSDLTGTSAASNPAIALAAIKLATAGASSGTLSINAASVAVMNAFTGAAAVTVGGIAPRVGNIIGTMAFSGVASTATAPANAAQLSTFADVVGTSAAVAAVGSGVAGFISVAGGPGASAKPGAAAAGSILTGGAAGAAAIDGARVGALTVFSGTIAATVLSGGVVFTPSALRTRQAGSTLAQRTRSAHP